ncbi:uncharacterized protein [Onthophagus taurus]|uniref:uncharacterized protein isoform X2 n=1 Tax=Onthophagus taurus TaxID=166361 RepID=UPI000C20B413|nr:uncharacterized protein LOC111425828 isoform X2 [Onthophagus taurus]
MSRPGSYSYTGLPAPPPHQYFYDEMEGYIGDYSESEGLSDAAPHLITAGNPDITELYRRKAMALPVAQNHYNHFLHAPPPPEYYYEPMRQPQMIRASTYRKRMPVIAEQPRYYSPERTEVFNPHQPTYRSTHQLVTSLPRNAVPASIPSATVVRSNVGVRRHPITVRTPKYYRRPATPAPIKRPSALCLPVAAQPDPAVYNKRNKRIPQDAHLYQNEYVFPISQSQSKHHPHYGNTDKNRLLNKDNLNVTRSKLDAALERYENIFEKNMVEFAGNPPDLNLVRMLKPKIPPTIKETQEKLKQQKSQKTQKEQEEVTSDALEEMLFADLKANGFTNNESGDFKQPPQESNTNNNEGKDDKTPRSTDGTSEKGLKDLPKSFNYQEIQNNVIKKTQQNNQCSQHTSGIIQEEPFEVPEQDVPNEKDIRKCESVHTKEHLQDCVSNPLDLQPESFRRICSQASSQRLNDNDRSAESIKSLRTATVPRVLVDDALELHRTKSYVVNLIDHALSNHFGTNLCEKYSTKENPIDHRVAVDILKKHSAGKMDKELCVEIAQALADTFNSSSTSCTAGNLHHDCEPKPQTSSCSCSKMSDEPLYVKQLKQLRWGHLKHIQREVRRLEDLERFLDSCSSNSYV